MILKKKKRRAYREMVLRLESNPRGGFQARTVSPQSSSAVPFEPPFTRDKLANLSPQLFQRPSTPRYRDAPTTLARDLGSELFTSLFQGQIGRAFDRLLGSCAGRAISRRNLRLRLHFDTSHPAVAELAALPWELLYDADNGGFLAQKLWLSVVRRLESPPPPPLSNTGPLRVLVAKAPDDGNLDLNTEEARIRQAWEIHDAVEIDVLRLVDRDSLRQQLLTHNYQVVHFMGHGDFDPVSGEGFLRLDETAGEGRLTAPVLANDLCDLSIRLVVLNACHSAYHSCDEHQDPYNGIATALVKLGVPAVVAMQVRISDAGAIAFSSAFYSALARNDSIDAAVVEGRKAIYSRDPGSLEWAIPALFLSSETGQLLATPSATSSLATSTLATSTLAASTAASPPPEPPKGEPEHQDDLSAKAPPEILAAFTGAARERSHSRHLQVYLPAAVVLLLLLVAGGSLVQPQKPAQPILDSANNPPECRSPPDIDIPLVYVPPGTATIGTDQGSGTNPLQLQTFTLEGGLCVGKTELTQAQWAKVMDVDSSDVSQPDLPQQGISAQQAEEFLRRFNEKYPHEKKLRFPTDKEYEYLLRATSGDQDAVEGVDGLIQDGNCHTTSDQPDDGYGGVAPVASFQPNPLGIYDLQGNVFEWVTSEADDVEAGKRVRRGGSFNSVDLCLPASRSIVSESTSHSDSGLRLVHDPIEIEGE